MASQQALPAEDEAPAKKIAIATKSLVILDGGFSNKLFPRTKIADERRRANASASPVLIFNGLLNQRRRWDANNINY
jgi:hypothetical protein